MGIVEDTSFSEELIIDFSHVPLKPIGKREITQLEIALIVATLYRPEILELIRDPIERVSWMENIAIAAGALARYKAGMPLDRIAEELGRSVITIKSHLNQKTRIGRLISETYERFSRGEVKLSFPITKPYIISSIEEVTTLREEVERIREINRNLEEQVNRQREEIDRLRHEISENENTIRNLNEKLEKSIKEKEELSEKYNKLLEEFKKTRDILLGIANRLNTLLSPE